MSLVNIFKISAVSGAGTIAGILPQMLLGLVILSIGLVIQKYYSKIAGLPFIIVGALMMFQTGLAISTVQNVI